MPTDAGQPLESPDDRRDLWRLPEILEIRPLRRRLPNPRRLTVRGEDRYIEEAVEIEVTVSEPFAIRALGPTLWVGEEPLTIAELVEPNRYRFLALNPQSLEAGAPIALSWSARNAPRIETKYRYEPASGDEAR
ncbi:MAG: hypothetical protein ABJC24_00390 [Chloroflexota bacterium]